MTFYKATEIRLPMKFEAFRISFIMTKNSHYFFRKPKNNAYILIVRAESLINTVKFGHLNKSEKSVRNPIELYLLWWFGRYGL